MADRISWGDFPELRDYDHFSYSDTLGTAGRLEISLAKNPGVTWWKALKVLERGTNRIVAEHTFEGTDNGPRMLIIEEIDMSNVKLVLAKAKIFGVHTDMYEIYELREKLGRRIDLVWLTDGPNNVFEAIGRFFSDIFTPVARAVITVVRAIVLFVLNVVTLIFNALAFVLSAVFAIPGFGRVLSALVHYLNFLTNFVVNTVIEVGENLLEGFGIRASNKYLRLAVVIQRDETGSLVATRAEIEPQIELLQLVFQVRANVLVIPYRPWDTPFAAAAFGVEPARPGDFIIEEQENSDPVTLDVRCGTDGYLDNLGLAGSAFDWKIARMFWGGTRRVAGLGGPIVAFAVRQFTVPPGSSMPLSAGCSLGPTTDYVTINFGGNTYTSTLAHEIGHACALIHSDSPPAGFNLMQAERIDPPVPGNLRNWLTNEQAYLIRASFRTVFV